MLFWNSKSYVVPCGMWNFVPKLEIVFLYDVESRMLLRTWKSYVFLLDFRYTELGCNLQDDNFLWLQISKLQRFCNYFFFRIVVFILQQVIKDYIIDL